MHGVHERGASSGRVLIPQRADIIWQVAAARGGVIEAGTTQGGTLSAPSWCAQESSAWRRGSPRRWQISL
jgi:hypothetical protein